MYRSIPKPPMPPRANPGAFDFFEKFWSNSPLCCQFIWSNAPPVRASKRVKSLTCDQASLYFRGGKVPSRRENKQHNYATRSASLQHLNPDSFRINIRKFCPTILGCYYWNDILYLCAISQLENYFKKHFISFILLSTDNSNLIYVFTMRLLFPL